jgi:hypothetical protein
MNKPLYSSRVHAKTIEGHFRLLQVRLKASIKRALRRDPGAPKDFPTVEELRSVYEQATHECNAHHGGKLQNEPSPRGVWITHAGKNPPRKIAAESRFLMGIHCRRIRITIDGITLVIANRKHVYFSEQTGGLVGKTVCVYFHPEEPAMVVVHDPELPANFVVPEIIMPALSASAMELAAVQSAKDGHLSKLKRSTS